VQNTYSSSSTSMRWSIVQASTGKYKFINKKSGKLMDVQGGSTSNGTPVIEYTANGGQNQLWTFTRTGDGFYKFSPATNSNAGLDDHNFSTTPGSDIVEWTYTGATNQEWVVAPAN
jgi:hypothetical protein